MFTLAMCGFVFAWMMFFPYLMGLCAAYDPLGRLSALNLALQYGGLTLGSGLAGVIAELAGYGTLIITAAAGYFVSAALILWAANYRERMTTVLPLQMIDGSVSRPGNLISDCGSSAA